MPFTKDLDKAVKGADAVILSTKHRQYLNLDLKKLKNQLATPILIDGRNAYNEEKAAKAGFTYLGVGKGKRQNSNARN